MLQIGPVKVGEHEHRKLVLSMFEQKPPFKHGAESQGSENKKTIIFQNPHCYCACRSACSRTPGFLEVLDWICPSWLRTQAIRNKTALALWDLDSAQTTLYRRGSAEETAGHLLQCPLLPSRCTLSDLSHSVVGARDAAASSKKFLGQNLGKFRQIWAKVIKIWANLNRFEQNQNLAFPKTLGLLRLCTSRWDTNHHHPHYT